MSNSSNIITIDSQNTEVRYWKDFWHYRELLYFLSWRDFLVRYKQTIIGIFWSIIRPFLTMLVLTLVFGKIAKLPSNNIPYPLIILSAILPWQFFSNAIIESSNSIINNSALITKIYFPRAIIPASITIVSLTDFISCLIILLIFMGWYHFIPDYRIIFLPFFLLLLLILALGTGFWFSSINVKYRDFKFIIPFLVQLGIYISPVGFNSNIIPEKWRIFYSLNPITGIIDGFRWSTLRGNQDIYLPGLILSIVLSIVIFISGIWYFRKIERGFADII
jgi:lipopolysaccharide transport system permease protein